MRIGLDVLDHSARVLDVLHRPLVLVKKRQRLDQGEELPVIAAGSDGVIREVDLVGEGVHDDERPERPLGVSVPLDNPLAFAGADDALNGLVVALNPLPPKVGSPTAKEHSEYAKNIRG